MVNTNPTTRIVDLNGEWRLYSLDKSVQITATVPGQAHLDLIHAKVLQDDPYYGMNYVKDSMRKFIMIPWIFEKEFVLQDRDDTSFYIAILDCEGLDTLATITVNGVAIGSTNNQFRRYMLDVTDVLQPGSNVLQIQFEDAVEHAKDQAAAYPYYVPDMFNMSAAQHGFPRRNFVRKEQCSFSWDWGPAFAPCGIWRPISLRLDDQGILVKRWRVNTFYDKYQGTWQVQIYIELIAEREQKLSAKFRLEDIMPISDILFPITTGENTVKHSFAMMKSAVEPWWPRGYGNQTLYLLEATLENAEGAQVAAQSFRCGFRTCELAQDQLVQGKPGDGFKFRLNGVDMFAKGTNWIPGHVFDRLMTMEKKRSLLESCVAANMNMVRIWGGGRYETDEFYQLCDELGIMVWQEFMFACALYPTDGAFLENVRQEVSDQVRRLMVHPSIVLWSGNNENQEFMVKGWDEATVLNPYVFTVDYHKLYIETIMSTLATLDDSRPFVSSSPSAGLISNNPYTERYILKDEERGLFGDVHFYDYKHNGLHVEYYPNARFVSEYGAQSMPSFKAWKKVSALEDWHPLSQLSVHRNHHGNGQLEMLEQIEHQFKLPMVLSKYYHEAPDSEAWPKILASTRENLFDVFCYLTQIVQARSITGQTQHYIRGRSGDRNTMGALYWQLNDIWPAPTWSSIEHEGRWKPLHNFVKISFADILVSGYQPAGDSFEIHISNDRSTPIDGQLIVRSYEFESGQLTETLPIQFSVHAFASKLVLQVSSDLLGQGNVGKEPVPRVLFASATLSATVGPGSVQMYDMLPQPFPMRDALPLSCFQEDPTIVVEQFVVVRAEGSLDDSHITRSHDYQVRITLRSSSVAGYVWLEWREDDVEGYFDENAFWMLPDEPKLIVFQGKGERKGTGGGDVRDIEESNLQIKTLYDVLQSAALLSSV